MRQVTVELFFFDAGGGHRSAMNAVTAILEETRPHWVLRATNLQELFESIDPVFIATRIKSENIYNAALNSAAFEGMATTLVIAWFLGERLWIAHTGDSRLYRYRKGQLEQLTRDHSFSQELLDAGMVTEEEARLLPAKNLVTRALGAAADIEPEIRDVAVEPGDLLMLCSDGLTEMVGTYEIAGLLSIGEDDTHETARRLVDLANESGGRDNISVILVQVVAENG